MYALDVAPISKDRLRVPLTYFSKDKVRVGAFVEISFKNKIISSSREKYGTKRSTVEGEARSQIYPLEDIIQLQEVKSIEEENIEPIIKSYESLQSVAKEKLIETKEKLVEKKAQSEHRYLQSLIKRMAESRGFKAVIEQPTPDGKGRIDVSLERNARRIACEIARTTTVEWEVHNIKKCLVAGYDTIIVCAKENNSFEKIHKKCTFIKFICNCPASVHMYAFPSEDY